MSKLWIKFKTYSAVKVSIEDCQDVNDFLKACKKELLFFYGQFPPGELSLSTTEGGSPLEPDDPIPAPNTAKTPLFISVEEQPTVSQGSRTSSKSNLNAPHPKRKERWGKLNVILERNKKKSKKSNSTAYSYVTWKQVKNIICTTPYFQSTKAIPKVKFDFLSQYLSVATKCFGSLSSGKESHRLHLIAPIIICVCSLLDDVQILVEEDLDESSWTF